MKSLIQAPQGLKPRVIYSQIIAALEALRHPQSFAAVGAETAARNRYSRPLLFSRAVGALHVIGELG